MKTIVVSLAFFIGFSSQVKAQENLNTGLGFGMQLVEYQDDFGIGLNLSSPYFVHDRIGIRLKSNLMYHQAVIDGSTTWAPYGNVSLGFIGVGGNVSERIRLYGEGGFIAILPSNLISNADIETGGYGVFGFEFFFSHFGNYFIELGGMGSGAVADRLDGAPIYSNGFTMSTGFRYFLR